MTETKKPGIDDDSSGQTSTATIQIIGNAAQHEIDTSPQGDRALEGIVGERTMAVDGVGTDTEIQEAIDGVKERPAIDAILALDQPDTAGPVEVIVRDANSARIKLNNVSADRTFEESSTNQVTSDHHFNQAFYEEFPGVFRPGATLSQHGLRLVSIKVRKFDQSTAERIHSICPQAPCLVSFPILKTEEQILHFVIDNDRYNEFRVGLNRDSDVTAIATGGQNSRALRNISGIRLIGGDIENNNKFLKQHNGTGLKEQIIFKSSEEEEEPEQTKVHFKTEAKSKKPKEKEIEAEEVKDMQCIRCFVYHLTLNGNYATEDIERINEDIAEIAITKRGCNIETSGNDFLIYAAHERPDHILLLLEDIREYLNQIGLSGKYMGKLIHGDLGYEKRTYKYDHNQPGRSPLTASGAKWDGKYAGKKKRKSQRRVQGDVDITMTKVFTGSALKILAQLPCIPNETPISGLDRFDDERYRMRIEKKRVITRLKDGTQMTIDTIGKISKDRKLHKRGHIGRADENKVVDRWMALAEDRSRNYEIGGIASIGKTSLILHAIPKNDRIVLKIHKGRGKLALMDFAQLMCKMVEEPYPINEEDQSKEARFIRSSLEYFRTLIESDGDNYIDADTYKTYAMDVIKYLGAKKREEGHRLCLILDDLDDNETESLLALSKIVDTLGLSSEGAAIKGNTNYPGVVSISTFRSDISYAEDLDKQRSIATTQPQSETRIVHGQEVVINLGKGGHMSTLNYLRDNSIHDKLTLKEILIGQEDEEGLIGHTPALEDFVVGKTLEKFMGGRFADHIDTARVSNLSSFAGLIIQKVGQRESKGRIVAIPHLMVQIVNELRETPAPKGREAHEEVVEEGLIAYNTQTRELYVVDYSEAKASIPDEPEGMQAKQFNRMIEGHQNMALHFALLEGLPQKALEQVEVTGLGTLDDYATTRLIDERKIIHFDDSACLRLSFQWRIFLNKKLKENPAKTAKMQAHLTTALLAIDNDTSEDNEFRDKISALMIYRLALPTIEAGENSLKARISTRYALKAAQEALSSARGEEGYRQALECAQFYLSGRRLIKKFEATLVAIEACVYMNDFDQANTYSENLDIEELNEDQIIQLAEVLLTNAYLYFKYCELGLEHLPYPEKKAKIEQALDKYKETIGLFKKTPLNTPTHNLEQDFYGNALLNHHTAIALTERLGKGMFKPETDGAFFEINPDKTSQETDLSVYYEKALQYAHETEESLALLGIDGMPQRVKILQVTNITLLGAINLACAQVSHGADNNAVIACLQAKEDSVLKQRSQANIESAIAYATTSLRLSVLFKLFSATTRERASTCKAVSSLLNGNMEGIRDLIQSALILAANVHPKARVGALIHIGDAAIEAFKGISTISNQWKTYLLEQGYDLTAEIYRKYPAMYFAIYNHAEACILKATAKHKEDTEKNRPKAELEKAIQIIEEKIQTLRDNDYQDKLVKLLRLYLEAVKQLKESEYDEEVEKISTFISDEELSRAQNQ